MSFEGQRCLMIKSISDGDPNATPASMVVVLNWFEELKQRVPTNGKMKKPKELRGLVQRGQNSASPSDLWEKPF